MAAIAAQTTSNALGYFPLDTGLFADDDKIFELTDGQTDDMAFASISRYIFLLSKIYACDDGPAMEVSPRMGRMLARKMGLTVEGFEDFVGRCVDAELFDPTLWRQVRVLTSRGIQRRWKLAKKRSGMPQPTLQWSLLGEEGGWSADECRDMPSDADESRANPTRADASRREPSKPDESRREPTKPAKDKDKGKEKEKGKKEDQSVYLSGEEEAFDNRPQTGTDSLSPACLAEEQDGSLFLDSEGNLHRTRYGALESTYRAKTGRTDFAALARKVAELCPGGCRASPADRAECFNLVSDAMERYDPGKGSCWALVRHVLTHDRGDRDA